MLLFSGIRQLQKKKKKKKKNRGPQADQRLLSSAKLWYVLGEAESHLWISTHYHDDSAAYHLDEHAGATTEKILTAECVFTI